MESYHEGLKKDLLKKLINNPETNVLRVICTQNAPRRLLGWILFNHPSYGLHQKRNYLEKFFHREDIYSPTINALRFRISSLTLNDFEKIGMDKYIDKKSLKKFKSYADDVILDFIKENKISYYGVEQTYKTRQLRTLQHEAFYSLWKAVAQQNNDFFISYPTIFEEIGFSETASNEMYTKFISRPKMLWDSYIKRIMNYLTKSINNIEKSLGVLNFYSSRRDINSLISELDALYEAKSKFAKLQSEIIEAILKHEEAKSGSFLFNLYKPDYENEGYSYGFKRNRLYKAFSKVSLYIGCYGTDILSGEPIIKRANRHHPDNKRSLALSELVFAQMEYHIGKNSIYEDIVKILPDGSKVPLSCEDFNRLQEGLRKLYKIGLSKDASDIQNGEWITEEDFKAVFPETETFSFTYNGIDYDGVSLLEMWKDIFTDNLGFGEKFKEMNAKITTIKDAELNDKDPFIELLKNHAPWYRGMVEEAKRFIEKLSDPSIITDPPQLGPFTIFGYIGSDIYLFDFYRSIYWI